MYKGNRILAIVPARGGSKGIPLKNLRHVGDRSLVGWVGTVVQEVDIIDRVVASTDHEEIAQEAELWGIPAPFRRPKKLSGDRIGDIDVLQHGLTVTEEIDRKNYDVIVMLQPTSPCRRASHILAAIKKLVDGGYNAVWSVSKTDIKAHPLKQLVVDPNGALRYYDPRGAMVLARQQLAPVYHRNGIVYVLTRKALLDDGYLLPEHSSALIIDDPVVNIDTIEDLKEAERYLGNSSIPT